MPAAEFRNWAGGFENIDAAASFFASAGTPCVVRRTDAAGQVQSVRLDHFWVRAFVDYFPSRGASPCGPGDTWVELDAAYKQYEFTKPIDLDFPMPSDETLFLEELLNKAVVESSTGAITGVDTQALDVWVRKSVEDRQAYYASQGPELTVKQVAGGRTVVSTRMAVLPMASPYTVLNRGDSFTDVPESLRHHLTLDLSTDEGGDVGNLLHWRSNLPALSVLEVLLLYHPASEAEDTLLRRSFASGNALPSSIRVIPKLQVGDEIKEMASPVSVGTRVFLRFSFDSPTISTPSVINEVYAGEVTAVGLDLQGIPQERLETLRVKATAIKQETERPDGEIFGTDFARVLLGSAVVAWFAGVDSMSSLSSRREGVETVRYPSLGLFSVRLQVTSAFGQPLSVSPQGFGMDIDRDVTVTEAFDGDRQKVVGLAAGLGAYGSTLEAEVPLKLLSFEGNPTRAASTMHALRAANDQGIPIHRIDRTNAAAIVPRLAYAQTDIDEIQSAVAVGLEVLIPERPVDLEGHDLVACVVQDSVTGSASYLIGGSNGAIALLLQLIVISVIMVALMTASPSLAPATSRSGFSSRTARSSEGRSTWSSRIPSGIGPSAPRAPSSRTSIGMGGKISSSSLKVQGASSSAPSRSALRRFSRSIVMVTLCGPLSSMRTDRITCRRFPSPATSTATGSLRSSSRPFISSSSSTDAQGSRCGLCTPTRSSGSRACPWWRTSTTTATPRSSASRPTNTPSALRSTAASS